MLRSKALADRVNIGTKDEMEIIGYMPNRWKFALTVVLSIFTAGLLLILLTWKSSIRLSFTHKRCALQDAKRLLLKDIYGQLWEEEVLEEEYSEGESKVTRSRKYFTNKKIKYVWDEITCTFTRVQPLEPGSTFNSFHRRESGLSGRDAKSKKILFGENFMKIEILSIWQLLIQQAVNPFYIFQAYTIVLWCIQEYFLFSGCILGLSIISITAMVWETRKQTLAVRERVMTESTVTVLRDGVRNIVSSRDVVPGDVILLKSQMGFMEVDVVVLRGAVVTNEAMLTGESIPVTKVGIPLDSDILFCEEENKHHMLYSGTEILQVRGGSEIPALVLKTGFYTTRGELVRSILFPKPADFHFYSDFLKMLLIFIILGLAAMSWSLYHFIALGASWKEVLINSLDLVTFVVPPILPATITAINAAAQKRLKKHGIFCLSSNYISLAGSVDVVCFDKTGTLTENDLALAGVLPCHNGELQDAVELPTSLSLHIPLTKALATCHSLFFNDDKLMGDPLDVKIFSWLDWTLIECESVINQDYGMITPLLVQSKPREGQDSHQQEMAILKTFPFESNEQRMTVITRNKNSTDFEVYIKGAPEKIAALCEKDTVPNLMDAALDWYTGQGLRVVAIAGKSLPNTFTWEKIERSSREKLESGAKFLGFVVLQNRVKAGTASVISTLHSADISTVMITGDSLLTALSVARESELISPSQQVLLVKAQNVSASSIAAQHLKVDFYDLDQINSFQDKEKTVSVRNDDYVLAVDGPSFDLIYRGQDRNLFSRLIHKGKIFARMKPDQKVTVVETLRDLGHQVAMCGDGCNDCGALKVANCGISLSSSEASVAAPFTSTSFDVQCVPILIREGRAALVSLFTAFKYNVSMCFSSLICVLFQFSVNTMPTDRQYLIMDLLLGTIPGLVIGITGAASYLVPRRPTKRILSPLPALSILSFLAFQTLTYWCVLNYVESQPWFEPVEYNGKILPPVPSYENTALMLVNFHAFNIGVIVYSHSSPYRARIYTNYMLSPYLVLSVIFCLFVNFDRGDWMTELLNFYAFPDSFIAAMIFFAVSISCLVCLVWERWVLYGLMEKYLLPWIKKTCGPHALHIKVDRDLMSLELKWPTLSEFSEVDASPNIDKKPLKATESLNIYDEIDVHDESVLMRKLTQRHKFKASVKYVKEGPKNPQYAASHMGTSSPTEELAPGSGSCNYTQQKSVEYQVPFDTHENKNDNFKHNYSIQGQRMRGTGGGFRTFRGNANKRQEQADVNLAEPYEVFRLTDINEAAYGESETYSAVYGSPPSTVGVDYKDMDKNHSPTRDNQQNEQVYEEEFAFPETITEGSPPKGSDIYDVPPKRLESQEDEPDQEDSAEFYRDENIPGKVMSQMRYIDEDISENNLHFT
ncbi:hypothetical protein SK128_023001 [Halocaridina rubra]|uniref:Cation-transporting ATPase n=1 Tax=Halocaridina rubra TaxID=373956 RepID=A0AAN8XGG2_HALRR